MTVTDAANLLRTRVDDTIAALELDEKDAAAVKLAQHYADLIDVAFTDGDRADRSYVLRWHGPILIALLAELGATPAARAAIANRRKDSQPAAADNRLELLRSARTQSRSGR